jgi:hypothetical protein
MTTHKVTTYKDRAIHYDEDACLFIVPMSDLKASTLGALKTAIDKLSADERRVSRPALMIATSFVGPPRLIDVTVTTLVAPNPRVGGDPTEAWIKKASGERAKERLYSLLPPTLEVREAFARYLAAIEARKAAQQAEAEARDAIPCFTAADLQAKPEPSDT